jgi:tetratricopeptide (TPR) repeat protein
MTKIQRHCYFAVKLLVTLCISTAVSLAQRPTETPNDPFAVMPASDALLVLDLNRLQSEVVPRLLLNEPDARALVIALPDPKTIDLLDPRAVQRVVVGFRFINSLDEKTPSDFEVVTVAQSSEAGQLPALIRSRGAGKYREEQYAGKLLYITHVEQPEPNTATTATLSDKTEWAIVALDTNTLVFGQPAYVRSSIDVNSGKGTTVNADLVTAVKRNSKAWLSAAGLLPPSSMFAGQDLANSDLGHMLSSLKRFYASVEVVPAGLELAITLNTASPEQAKSLVDLLGAFKTIAATVAPGKTKQDKVGRDLIKGLVISAAGSDVQIRDEITQASVDEFAKEYATRMYFAQGLAQSENGDSEAAIAAYDKVIMLDPTNASAFINRGKVRANKGALDAALVDYDKAISLDPDNGLTYNNRCYARVKKGDFEAAIVDCDKAISLDPTFAYAYNNRGRAFASLGKLEKAIPDYEKSIALDEENIFAYLNRGDARIKTGNFDGAIADFEKCLGINAKSVEAYNGRGLARYYKGEFDQALTDLNKALALDPNAAVTYNNRALALVAKGSLDKAMDDYNKSIALNDKDDLVYANRGSLRNQKGDWSGAIADFDKAIALNPKSAQAYNSRGIVHYNKSDLDQAIADYDKAIAIDPNLAEAYGNRALCLLELRRDAQAEQDLKTCFALDESLRSVFDPAVKEIKKTRRHKSSKPQVHN